MDNHTQRIVNKAWSCAHVLRDAGLPFHSYTQQITYLLFLKMADERTKPLSLQGDISFDAWKLIVQSCAKALPSSGWRHERHLTRGDDVRVPGPHGPLPIILQL
jgi:hypothetical protein